MSAQEGSLWGSISSNHFLQIRAIEKEIRILVIISENKTYSVGVVAAIYARQTQRRIGWWVGGISNTYTRTYDLANIRMRQSLEALYRQHDPQFGTRH